MVGGEEGGGRGRKWKVGGFEACLLMMRVQCFKTDDQLIVAYSMTPAFG